MSYEKRLDGLTLEETLEKYRPLIWKIIKSKGDFNLCNSDDLYQEAQIAIWRAFEKESPDCEYKFSAIVPLKIESAVDGFLRKNISPLSGGERTNYKYRKLCKDLGRVPTDEELLDAHFRKSTIVGLRNLYSGKISLDCSAFDDQEKTIGEVISVNDCISKEFNDYMSAINFFNYNQYLTELESQVITYYFGLDRKIGSLTKTEIAEELNLTARNVDTTLNSALNKLRNCKDIEDYGGPINNNLTSYYLPNDIMDRINCKGVSLGDWNSLAERDAARLETIRLMKEKRVRQVELCKKFNINDGTMSYWCNIEKWPSDTYRRGGYVVYILTKETVIKILDYLHNREVSETYAKNGHSPIY